MTETREVTYRGFSLRATFELTKGCEFKEEDDEVVLEKVELSVPFQTSFMQSLNVAKYIDITDLLDARQFPEIELVIAESGD